MNLFYVLIGLRNEVLLIYVFLTIRFLWWNVDQQHSMVNWHKNNYENIWFIWLTLISRNLNYSFFFGVKQLLNFDFMLSSTSNNITRFPFIRADITGNNIWIYLQLLVKGRDPKIEPRHYDYKKGITQARATILRTNLIFL